MACWMASHCTAPRCCTLSVTVRCEALINCTASPWLLRSTLSPSIASTRSPTLSRPSCAAADVAKSDQIKCPPRSVPSPPDSMIPSPSARFVIEISATSPVVCRTAAAPGISTAMVATPSREGLGGGDPGSDGSVVAVVPPTLASDDGRFFRALRSVATTNVTSEPRALSSAMASSWLAVMTFRPLISSRRSRRRSRLPCRGLPPRPSSTRFTKSPCLVGPEVVPPSVALPLAPPPAIVKPSRPCSSACTRSSRGSPYMRCPLSST
mmetsp:Transcript_22587/g.58989  ORF Transcript_22587/g.58989 Transcript_22587/m.58989 type:complete len:266 (+) Transcript_22587:44-841(+)